MKTNKDKQTMEQKKEKAKKLKLRIENLQEKIMYLMNDLRMQGYDSELHLSLKGDAWSEMDLSIRRVEEV